MSKIMRSKKLHIGQGLVEFALVLPLILLLVMGIIDFGRIFYVYSASSNAAREAIRVGITDPNNCSGIVSAAQSQLAFMPPEAYDTRIWFEHFENGAMTKDEACPSVQTLEGGDRIVVDVQAQFSLLTPLISRIVPTLPVRYTSARTVAFVPTGGGGGGAGGGAGGASGGPPATPTPTSVAAPNPPTNLRVMDSKCQGNAWADLAWDASVQPPAVSSYNVYKGVVPVCSGVTGTTCRDSNLGESDTYSAQAVGTTGLVSAPSNMAAADCGANTPTPTATSTPAGTPIPPTPTSSPIPPTPTSSPTATPSASVSPILECTVDQDGGTFQAFFGYENDNASVVIIPVGSDNQFSPTPADRGQPTTFQTGRTPYWPDAAFSANLESTLVWTLNANGQAKTATASQTSQPCSQHVYIDKVWYDASSVKMSGPPAGLPANYQITAQSILGTAACSYPTGSSTLACTFTNRQTGPRAALDNDGLWAPVGTTYTVTESNLPAGWTNYGGTGVFASNIGGYCINGRDGLAQNCTHWVQNAPPQLVVGFVSGYPDRISGGPDNKDIYGKVRVTTYGGSGVSSTSVTFTRGTSTYTAMTDSNGYACIQLGSSNDSGETVSVTAASTGYRNGTSSGTTADGSLTCP